MNRWSWIALGVVIGTAALIGTTATFSGCRAAEAQP